MENQVYKLFYLINPTANLNIKLIKNQQAILQEQQIDDKAQLKKYYQTGKTHEPVRINGCPVGLQNFQLTCYFNSLLQTYFMNHKFVYEILNFKEPEIDYSNLVYGDRIKASVKLVSSLQYCFARMIMSDEKAILPADALIYMLNNQGQQIIVGEEKDINEFNIQFIHRIEEALKLQQKYQNQPGFQLINNISLEEQFYTQESVISTLFYGKACNFLEFENQAAPTVKQAEEVFWTIYLDVQHQNLEESWNQASNQVIEDYKLDGDKKVKVTKTTYIAQAPETLMFQISRANYNTQMQIQEKNNSEFTFEKEIYIDRHLLSNKDELQKHKQGINKLEKEIKSIKNQIHLLQSFNNAKIPILDAIQVCQSFYEYQKYNLAENKDKCFEDVVFFENSDAKIVDNMLYYMNQTKQQIESRISALKTKLTKTQEELKKTLKQFQKQKYKLVSILMHSGYSQTGHYFAFIFDHSQKKWRKYNDRHINEYNEDDVFEEAFGNQMSSAYCLVYFSEKFLDSAKKCTKNDQKQIQTDLLRAYSITQKQVIDYYVFELKKQSELFKNIESENVDFIANSPEDPNEELELIENIVKNYQKKFEFINVASKQIIAKRKNEKFNIDLPVLINFPLFLKTSKCYYQQSYNFYRRQ